MRINKNLTAVALACGLFATTAAFAFGPQPGCPFGGPQAAAPRASAWMQSRMEALESMLTLKANQKEAFKHYADAHVGALASMEKFREQCQTKPCADVQRRLERRAEKAALDAKNLKAIAEARSKLLSVLSAEQKYVLEMSSPYRVGPMCGMRQGPHMHHGFGFGPEPAMRHGPGMGPGTGMGRGSGPNPAEPMSQQ